MDKVRIGFIGVGGMGQCAHLRNYASLPDCEVAAIAELRPQLGRKAAARYGVPRVYTDHREMLASEQLDALIASQPFQRHGALIPGLLTAGVPVFMEKPLAGSIEAGEAIVEAVGNSSTWIMLGYHKRSDPAVAYAKAKIEDLKQSGELGALRYVRISMPAGDWIAGGFSDLIETGEAVPALEQDAPPSEDPDICEAYTAFVNYYIHQVNLLRHLLGEPYRVSYADRAGILLIAESASGVTGLIEMSPYRTSIDWQESAFIAFERGWIRVSLPAPLAINRPGAVEIFHDPGQGMQPSFVSPQMPWISAMRQQAMNFLSAVRGETKPLCEPSEALEDLKIARDWLSLAKGCQLRG